MKIYALHLNVFRNALYLHNFLQSFARNWNIHFNPAKVNKKDNKKHQGTLSHIKKKEENVCIVQAYPESNVMGDEESDLILRSPWLPRTGEICKLVNDSVDSWKEEKRNQRFRVCLIISLFIFKV